MENIIIKDAKKLSARIGQVSKSLHTASENVQVLLASSIWRGLAHGDNSGADKLLRGMPARLQGPVKNYLLAHGPFVYRDNAVCTKKGTRPNEAEADKIVADLPDWQTWKKEAGKKDYDASKAIASIFKTLRQRLSEGKVQDGHIDMVNALLSFESNITAGITREKMLADMAIASEAVTLQEKQAA